MIVCLVMSRALSLAPHVSSHCPISCVTTCPRQFSVSRSAKSRESFPKCNSFSLTLSYVSVCSSRTLGVSALRCVLSLSPFCLLRDTFNVEHQLVMIQHVGSIPASATSRVYKLFTVNFSVMFVSFLPSFTSYIY